MKIKKIKELITSFKEDSLKLEYLSLDCRGIIDSNLLIFKMFCNNMQGYQKLERLKLTIDVSTINETRTWLNSLLEATKNCPCLKSISIVAMNIEDSKDSSFKVFFEHISKHPMLHVLDLSSNNFTDLSPNHAAALYQGISKCVDLAELLLGSNLHLLNQDELCKAISLCPNLFKVTSSLPEITPLFHFQVVNPALKEAETKRAEMDAFLQKHKILSCLPG